MADVKISGLPTSTTPLAGTEVLPIVQGGQTRQVSINNLTAGKTVSATKFIPTGGDATGNGMYLPAANTLAWSNNGAENMRLTSAGTLGIGVTPAAWAANWKVAQFGSCSVGTASSTGAAGRFYANAYFDGSNDVYINSSANFACKYIINGSGQHQWFTAPAGTAGNVATMTQVMTLDASGNLNVNTGNLVIGTSGKGIDFSATPGTGTSELLADYEVGNWTPVIKGATTVGTGTYTVQTGTYAKIGDVVHIQCFLVWTAHTGTGDMFLDGLPFTSSATTFNFSSVSIGQFENIVLTAANTPMASIPNNGTTISLRQMPSGGGGMANVAMDTNGNLIIGGTYRV